jgi:hypothetical protein
LDFLAAAQIKAQDNNLSDSCNVRECSRLERAAANRLGQDSSLQAKPGHAFVPSGQSVWKMGLNQDPEDKRKLCERLIVEQALEVFAPPRGETDHAQLRLEAIRPPHGYGTGYEVVVSRKVRVSLQGDVYPAEEPEGASVWVGYDTIHSDLPTAEQALRQVLGFLELRCE